MEKFELPALKYEYKALEPHISEEQLTIHHKKHHQGYVNGANAIFDTLAKARKEGTSLDMKSTLKALSFNIGGHVLHSMMWDNFAPNAKAKPEGELLKEIEKEFGSFDQFKKEFSAAAKTVEGSGWAALVQSGESGCLAIMQIEKHNTNTYPGYKLLLVLDLWEHAYYLDYKNERGKFIEAFWNIVNWEIVEKRRKE